MTEKAEKLADYLVGRNKAYFARAVGLVPGAIHNMLRDKRDITVFTYPDGNVELREAKVIASSVGVSVDQ